MARRFARLGDVLHDSRRAVPEGRNRRQGPPHEDLQEQTKPAFFLDCAGFAAETRGGGLFDRRRGMTLVAPRPRYNLHR